MHNTAVEVYLHNASMRGFYTRTSGMGPNSWPPLGVLNAGRMRITEYMYMYVLLTLTRTGTCSGMVPTTHVALLMCTCTRLYYMYIYMYM